MSCSLVLDGVQKNTQAQTVCLRSIQIMYGMTGNFTAFLVETQESNYIFSDERGYFQCEEGKTYEIHLQPSPMTSPMTSFSQRVSCSPMGQSAPYVQPGSYVPMPQTIRALGFGMQDTPPQFNAARYSIGNSKAKKQKKNEKDETDRIITLKVSTGYIDLKLCSCKENAIGTKVLSFTVPNDVDNGRIMHDEIVEKFVDAMHEHNHAYESDIIICNLKGQKIPYIDSFNAKKNTKIFAVPNEQYQSFLTYMKEKEEIAQRGNDISINHDSRGRPSRGSQITKVEDIEKMQTAIFTKLDELDESMDRKLNNFQTNIERKIGNLRSYLAEKQQDCLDRMEKRLNKRLDKFEHLIDDVSLRRKYEQQILFMDFMKVVRTGSRHCANSLTKIIDCSVCYATHVEIYMLPCCQKTELCEPCFRKCLEERGGKCYLCQGNIGDRSLIPLHDVTEFVKNAIDEEAEKKKDKLEDEMLRHHAEYTTVFGGDSSMHDARSNLRSLDDRMTMVGYVNGSLSSSPIPSTSTSSHLMNTIPTARVNTHVPVPDDELPEQLPEQNDEVIEVHSSFSVNSDSEFDMFSQE